jgi:TrwC relaxase
MVTYLLISMIRITTSHSAIEAEKYFDLALKTSDYYVKEHGIWGGKGAKRLGLKGRAERKDFVSLAENKVPGKNKRLRLRSNTTREEKIRDKETDMPILDCETGQPTTKEISNRRAGYDFTFSVPKSVSLYLAGQLADRRRRFSGFLINLASRELLRSHSCLP